MNIQEAVKKAVEIDGVICRESVYRPYLENFNVIKPTNSYHTCMVISVMRGKAYRGAKDWNPSADDLVSNDWNVLRDEF